MKFVEFLNEATTKSSGNKASFVSTDGNVKIECEFLKSHKNMPDFSVNKIKNGSIVSSSMIYLQNTVTSYAHIKSDDDLKEVYQDTIDNLEKIVNSLKNKTKVSIHNDIMVRHPKLTFSYDDENVLIDYRTDEEPVTVPYDDIKELIRFFDGRKKYITKKLNEL